jgi:hypothetical protein
LLAFLCTHMAHGASRAAMTNGLLGHYQFERSGADSLGRSARFELVNAPLDHGTLFLNGGYEHGGGPGGFRAIAAIPGLKYDSFTVSLDFWPVDFKNDRSKSRQMESFLSRVSFGYFGDGSQSSHDSIIVGGPNYRWFSMRQLNKGNLELTLNNQSFVHTFASATVATRRWHNLICSVDVKRRLILTVLDGRPLEPVNLPEHFKLDIVGTPDEATDNEFTFSNYSCGSAFHGFADNLKVFGHALSSAEMVALYGGTKEERPVFQPKINSKEEAGTAMLWWLSVALFGGMTVWFIRRRRRTVVPIN